MRAISRAGRPGSRSSASIESARGLEAAMEIAQADPRVRVLAFGGVDLAADLRAELAWEPLLYGAVAARPGGGERGARALDVPHVALDDEAALRDRVRARQGAGLHRQARHPSEAGARRSSRRSRRPRPSSTARAAWSPRCEQAGGNAVEFEGKMMDGPVVKAAQQLLGAGRSGGRIAASVAASCTMRSPPRDRRVRNSPRCSSSRPPPFARPGSQSDPRARLHCRPRAPRGRRHPGLPLERAVRPDAAVDRRPDARAGEGRAERLRDRPRLGRRPHPDHRREAVRRARRRHRDRGRPDREEPLRRALGGRRRPGHVQDRGSLHDRPASGDGADAVPLPRAEHPAAAAHPRADAPGTRVVTHDWDMGEWEPDESLVSPAPDKPVGLDRNSKIFLWYIPAKMAGRWRLETTLAPGRAATVTLAQKFQRFEGALEDRRRAARGRRRARARHGGEVHRARRVAVVGRVRGHGRGRRAERRDRARTAPSPDGSPRGGYEVRAVVGRGRGVPARARVRAPRKSPTSRPRSRSSTRC